MDEIRINIEDRSRVDIEDRGRVDIKNKSNVDVRNRNRLGIILEDPTTENLVVEDPIIEVPAMENLVVEDLAIEDPVAEESNRANIENWGKQDINEVNAPSIVVKDLVV